MSFNLLFPDKPIDVLVQDLIMNNWPETSDPDPTKLQITRNNIDWGHDYDEQTVHRATIKAASMTADPTSDLRSWKTTEYRADIIFRIQYRDVDADQPVELWNMGKQLQTIIFQHMNDLREPYKVHDFRNGYFEVEYRTVDNRDIHEFRQTVLAFFRVIGVNA